MKYNECITDWGSQLEPPIDYYVWSVLGVDYKGKKKLFSKYALWPIKANGLEPLEGSEFYLVKTRKEARKLKAALKQQCQELMDRWDGPWQEPTNENWGKYTEEQKARAKEHWLKMQPERIAELKHKIKALKVVKVGRVYNLFHVG